MSPIVMMCLIAAILFVSAGVYHVHKHRQHKKTVAADVVPSSYDVICNRYHDLIKYVRTEYDTSHRHYHNWDHIAEGLEIIAENEAELFEDGMVGKMNRTRLVLAWLFHDIVYDVGRDDNEEQSAEFATRALMFDFKGYMHEGIGKFILATKTHEPSIHHTANLLCDLDLVRLADPYERFLQHSENVYNEYKHVHPKLTKEDFVKRRAKFLADLSEKQDTLFKTNFFITRYEANAQRNIARFVTEFGSDTE
jgi:predicted metal-dependent HD superfamily phosphohydrolase